MDSRFLDQFPQQRLGSPATGASQELTPYARHLAQILYATDQETVWSLTCGLFRTLGFAHAMYGYSPDSWGPKLGAPEDYLVLSTFSAKISAEMVNEGHFLQSLTFHWALQNVGVASWSMPMEDSGVGPDFVVDPAALEFFARHGFVSGCSIGFPNERTRGNAVLALIAPETAEQSVVDGWLETHQEIIFVAATVSHNRLSTLPYIAPRGCLTARQREVLEWVAEGKTSADIATIMGISPPTVDKHLRLARETLGVDTTAHALIKAAFLNQVFVSQRSEPGGGAHGKTPPRGKKPA